MASRLRILTWNTWLQIDPSSKPNPNPDKRAPLIADKLSASNRDILLLQKVWSNRDELIDGINKEFVYISEKINDKHGLNLHAGLLTASRFKLKFLGSIDFEETLGIEGMFSNKGAALWEGTWEDNTFQLASVHLQGHASSEKQQEKFIKEGKDFLTENKLRPEVDTTASGLQYEVIVEGEGPNPTIESEVTVHYTGKLLDGTVFDSSVERGEPITFNLGQVIPGWTEGLQLMKSGAKYILYIPYDLAYGENGAGADIPPYSTLIFEVELISFK